MPPRKSEGAAQRGDTPASPARQTRPAPPAVADIESRVARSPVDPTSIPGWGVDADNENDPTWPMRDRAFDDAPGRHWPSPPPQAQEVEILMSIEHNQRPAVFGSAAPPAGLSGMLRRLAFKASESRWTHWLLLIGADRINVAEGVLDDLRRGHVPDLWAEFGLGAAWKHDRSAFVRRSAIALVVGGAALGAIGVLAWRRRA